MFVLRDGLSVFFRGFTVIYTHLPLLKEFSCSGMGFRCSSEGSPSCRAGPSLSMESLLLQWNNSTRCARLNNYNDKWNESTNSFGQERWSGTQVENVKRQWPKKLLIDCWTINWNYEYMCLTNKTVMHNWWIMQSAAFCCKWGQCPKMHASFLQGQTVTTAVEPFFLWIHL